MPSALPKNHNRIQQQPMNTVTPDLSALLIVLVFTGLAGAIGYISYRAGYKKGVNEGQRNNGHDLHR